MATPGELASLAGGLGEIIWPTAQTWVQWNTFYTPTGVTGGGLYAPQQTTGASNAVMNTAVWNTWNADAQARLLQQMQQPAPSATPEQITARAAVDRAYRLDGAKRELNRLRSVRRARRLLEEILSPEQREQLKVHGFFLVRQGNHIYRINRGKTHNVFLVDANGHAIENLCVIPDDYERVPEEDCMIAQKLLVEADHESFREIANIGRFGSNVLPSAPVPRPSAREWLRLYRRAPPTRARRAA